ncbi:MAG: DNA mismatch repair endonuclease MutL [Clostridia bacterium]|nr:DNA mismatch repair endonuclease MutL [Clostridia bacterium]
MGIINVLDVSVANLIAAGEVVERPASAIKEMVENSIDAGATEVTAEIKNGGISFIRVTDNGCGMTREDAMMCLRRHATSKIKNEKDLYAIMTLGFRGEALAAISAVTQMRIMTAKEGEELGTLITASYGSLRDVADSGCPVGTTIICEAMFAHTPARLKFMKSNASETAYVASVMEKMAISHPEVAIKFIADGKLRFSTSGDGNLKNAIYSVFGAFATKMAEVRSSHAGVRVNGYISTPDNVRGNRAMQHFFINSRSVKNKTLTAALEQAFRSYIPHDKFPSCVLDITLNCALVDVNIHPSKLEVKFSDEKAVFDALYYAVRGALESSLSRPALETLKSESAKITEEKLKVISPFVPKDEKIKYDKITLSDITSEKIEKIVPQADSDVPKAEAPMPKREVVFERIPEMKVPEIPRSKIDIIAYAEEEKIPERSVVTAPKSSAEDTLGASYYNVGGRTQVRAGAGLLDEKTASEIFQKSEQTAENKAPTIIAPAAEEPKLPDIPTKDAAIPGKKAKPIPEYTIVGELYASYVIMQLEDKVLIVDKHAAHERINFEILRAGLADLEPDVQLLLCPETLMLSNEEAAVAAEFEKEITASGFSFEIKDGKTALISGVPSGFEISEAKKMFSSLVSSLCEHGENIEFQRRSIFESALYQTACKASVKAGRYYDEAFIKYICDNLLRYDCIKYCPHGRPVAFELTKRELDRRFGRIK